MWAIETRQTLQRRILRLTGNRFEISVVSDDELWGSNLIESAISEIRRIERLLSTFSERSQTNLMNANAGIKPVKVDKEVYNLIRRSIKISVLTMGAFDITSNSINNSLLSFDKVTTSHLETSTPSSAVTLMNYKNIILDKKATTVFLKEKGMRIAFGGIAKGYAADRARLVLEQNGVSAGVVNVAGSVTTWGTQPNGKPWTVGSADPGARQHPFSYLQISDMSAATCDFGKFATNGKKHSHTINPKKDLASSEIKSVTIVCERAELACALPTPVTALGVTAGLDLINQMKNVACIIIDNNDKLYTSKNIQIRDEKII